MKTVLASPFLGGAFFAIALSLPIAANAAVWAYDVAVPKGGQAVFDQQRLPEPPKPPAGWSLRAIISNDSNFQCSLGDGYGGSTSHFAPPIVVDKDHVWTVRFYSEKSGVVPSGQPTNVVLPDWEMMTGKTTNQGVALQVANLTSIPRAALNATTDTHTMRVTITGIPTKGALAKKIKNLKLPFPAVVPAPCSS